MAITPICKNWESELRLPLSDSYNWNLKKLLNAAEGTERYLVAKEILSQRLSEIFCIISPVYL